MPLPHDRVTVSVLENRGEMNRRTTFSTIIVSLLLVVTATTAAFSHTSRKIWHTDLEAEASHLTMSKLATLADSSPSMSFILSARDEPDDNCGSRGVCRG
jgi:hypothetical protein